MDAATRELVRRRANNRCEHCQLPQAYSPFTHHIEHIVAKQHGGSDEANNLALACHRCNLRKGPNLTGMDPVTDEIVPLFHPRRDPWSEHFLLQDVRIVGVTPIGRATVHLLSMNDPRRLELRSAVVSRGE